MTIAVNKHKGFAGHQRPHKSGRIVVLIVGGILSGALFTIAVAALAFVRSRGIERASPEIAIEGKARIISTKGVLVPVTIRDEGSGLERVVVWVQQNGKAKEVFRQMLKQEKIFQRSIELSPQVVELTQGDVTLIIEAADASMWRNKSQKLLTFSVDDEPPRIDILARSEEIVAGEIGVAAYRVTEAALRSSGVNLAYSKDREDHFEGVAARGIDPGFNSPGLFISFFSLPDVCPSSLAVVAADEGGNVSRVPFSPECRDAAVANEHQQLVAAQDIIQKAESLVGSDNSWGEALRSEIDAAKTAGQKKERSAAIAIARFLLDTARASDYEEILKVTRTSSGENRYWRGAARFGVFVQRSGYNDSIVLADGQGPLAKSQPRGLEMQPAQTGFSVVFSPYRGIVRLSRRLGALGETVVIDHGAGLSSVFYSLEGRYVETGIQVDEGQQIGRIGDSGFHFSKALRMQFLLNGVPLNPGVLTDMQKFYANIEIPLNSLRSKFGISLPRNQKLP